MKRTLGIILALLLIAATGTFAQEPTSTGTIQTYSLRDAYPILKTMIDKEILLIGMPERDARVRVWITLKDDIYKVAVLRDFPVTVLGLAFFRNKVQLKGKFIYDSKLGYVFLAKAFKSL
jgi:hypothetical protein